MRNLILLISVLFASNCLFSQANTYIHKTNIPYYPDFNGTNSYISEKCLLDVYYPQNTSGFATIVWIHGGGLTSGEKELPEALKNKGFCVVSIDYRLHPKVTCPVYIEDAAAAVAWVFHHIGSYGGDSSLIFVSGHSAGGYLASMIGLDKKWLLKHRVNANSIAGIIDFSGQTITHFTIRKERGIPETQPIIDELAPLYHVRADAPPLCLITGDRELELLGRYEENAFMYRMMLLAGHKQTKLYELEGYDHNMLEPAFPLLVKEVQNILKLKNK